MHIIKHKTLISKLPLLGGGRGWVLQQILQTYFRTKQSLLVL